MSSFFDCFDTGLYACLSLCVAPAFQPGKNIVSKHALRMHTSLPLKLAFVFDLVSQVVGEMLGTCRDAGSQLGLVLRPS